MNAIDETNNVYGRLTVTGRAYPPNVVGKAYWYCQCECGTTIMAAGALLRANKIKSCGCLRREAIMRNRGRNLGKKYNKCKNKERAL